MTSLISASELKAGLRNKIIFDCRFRLDNAHYGKEQYRLGHIPGAFYLGLNRDLSGPVETHGGRHPLPDMDDFAQILRNAGVTRQSSIIVYDDSRFAYAARAWWLMKHIGLDDIQFLDGGFKAWVDAGGALDRREPPRKAGNLKIRLRTADTVNYEQLNAGDTSYTLIDSREKKRFLGEEEPIDPVAGHIPGALNYPWQEITDEQGFFKEMDFHKQRWQFLAQEKNLAVYCGSGVTACVNLLSLEMAGINAKLYPGSWSDWCSKS
jgi:thiosulfate/3-mercaptopyruvate sulfurtransferase